MTSDRDLRWPGRAMPLPLPLASSSSLFAASPAAAFAASTRLPPAPGLGVSTRLPPAADFGASTRLPPEAVRCSLGSVSSPPNAGASAGGGAGLGMRAGTAGLLRRDPLGLRSVGVGNGLVRCVTGKSSALAAGDATGEGAAGGDDVGESGCDECSDGGGDVAACTAGTPRSVGAGDVAPSHLWHTGRPATTLLKRWVMARPHDEHCRHEACQ